MGSRNRRGRSKPEACRPRPQQGRRPQTLSCFMNRTDLRAWRSEVQHLPLSSSHIVQATLFLWAFIKELKHLPGIEHSSNSNALEPLPPLPILPPLLCQLWKSLCPLRLAGALEVLCDMCLILAPCSCSQIGSLPSGTPAD